MDVPPLTYVAVVDDDASMCRSYFRLLNAAGFTAITYPSGEAFLTDAKRPRFDCLLLDVQLGGISGLELCRRLRSMGSGTPVIFITAHDNPDVREQAMAEGCAGFFSKNDSGQGVLDTIRRIAVARPPVS